MKGGHIKLLTVCCCCLVLHFHTMLKYWHACKLWIMSGCMQNRMEAAPMVCIYLKLVQGMQRKANPCHAQAERSYHVICSTWKPPSRSSYTYTKPHFLTCHCDRWASYRMWERSAGSISALKRAKTEALVRIVVEDWLSHRSRLHEGKGRRTQSRPGQARDGRVCSACRTCGWVIGREQINLLMIAIPALEVEVEVEVGGINCCLWPNEFPRMSEKLHCFFERNYFGRSSQK